MERKKLKSAPNRLDAQLLSSEDGFSRALLEDIGYLDAQRRGQVVLVFLLLRDDFANLLGQGEMPDGLGLGHALAIGLDRVGLIIQIETQHILGFL